MYIIIAPYNRATGGVELAHQMCAQLNELKPDCAKMAYFDNEEASFESFPVDQDGPTVYDKYKVPHVKTFAEMDQMDNVVIIPEGITPIVSMFQFAKKVIWWMSVDGYLNCFEDRIPTNLDKLAELVDMHLYQSEYARDFLQKNLPQADVLQVTDYINELYGTFLYPGEYRKNIVLYNPSKGLETVLELQKEITEVSWVPLVNLGPEELMILMQTAKVYVDFGSHPGKDRIPREAAVNGCCVITNKKGSAAFAEDVPILPKYKFEDPIRDVMQVKQLILDICDNYELHSKDFETYREWIKEEHIRFTEEVSMFMDYFETKQNEMKRMEERSCDSKNIPGRLFEDAKIKNKWIAETGQDVLIFANESVTSAEEIEQMLEDYTYMSETSLLVLCKCAPKENHLYGILADVDLVVYAMVIRRELFAQIGSFNDLLSDETNREFLCRAVQVCEPIFLECSGVEWERTRTENVFFTNAYLLVRYLKQLSADGLMEQMLNRYVAFANDHGYGQYFESQLEKLLASDQKLYQKIALATAPFFVIRGGDICYGVLQTFADQFAKALIQQGQRVIVTSGNQLDEEQMDLLQRETFRGIVGFQATVLQRRFFHGIKGKRFNFWFDHPMFFHTLFNEMDTPVTFLCQDGDHADYIEQRCPMGHGIHFPPGVNERNRMDEQKQYDICFMGTYFDPEKMWAVVNGMEGPLGDLAREVAVYLLDHTDVSYNEVASLFLGQYPQLLEQYSYEVIMEHIWEACRIAPYTYRNRVVRTILDAGFELHVYGDSWKEYPRQESDRLVCHDAVEPEEMSLEIHRSKISLNVMSWHKAGMTERIMEIMMAGSVCLTDETRYLKKHFNQMEDIVMFQLDELDQLPDMIEKLLKEDALRQKITEHAYQKVMSEHTWDVRAEQFLDMVKEMEEA